MLLTSVPFAFAHLSNPNVVPGVTFANTALAGIWLAAAYLRTRSLWFPLGVHWAWNWALGAFFGLLVLYRLFTLLLARRLGVVTIQATVPQRRNGRDALPETVPAAEPGIARTGVSQ